MAVKFWSRKPTGGTWPTVITPQACTQHVALFDCKQVTIVQIGAESFLEKVVVLLCIATPELFSTDRSHLVIYEQTKRPKLFSYTMFETGKTRKILKLSPVTGLRIIITTDLGKKYIYVGNPGIHLLV